MELLESRFVRPRQAFSATVASRSSLAKPPSRKSGSCVQKNCAISGVHPTSFSPTSVQFKGEINDALPRKRHQKRHLEFCTAYLLSRMPQVRVLPGAPSH